MSSHEVGASNVGKNYSRAMSVETLDTLGERIRYAREAAGLTQAEVAKHFEIRRVSVTQWEANDTKPALGRLVELAALLNTTPEWLMERKGFPPLVAPRQEVRLRQPELIAGEHLVGERNLRSMPPPWAATGTSS